MENKYYLIKLLTNTQGQDGSTISVYNDKNNALVAYHQTLATFHNAPDVLYAIVKVENLLGNTEIMEIVDHIPEPEPVEEETTEEPTDEVEEEPVEEEPTEE